MHQNEQASKVFYRPIEAAIRWAGLLRYEHVVLAAISSSRHLPQSLDCPRWDEVRLYTDRIYDGILNGELPFGKNGITINDNKLSGQSWRVPALRPRAPSCRGTGQAREHCRLAMGAEALREAATASQTGQRPEHLDLRSHRATQIEKAARVPIARSQDHLRRGASRQSLSQSDRQLKLAGKRISKRCEGRQEHGPLELLVSTPGGTLAPAQGAEHRVSGANPA